MDLESRKPVGLAIGHALQWADGLTFRLAELCVNPDCQGKGIGSRLLRNMEQTAVELGARTIHLTTEGDAVAFYSKLGYKAQPQLVVMSRPLS